MDLADFTGRRVEVELDGRQVRGRVVRGPARSTILLEERGLVGEERSDTHTRLAVVKTWTSHELKRATAVRLLSNEERQRPQKSKRSSSWKESVALAESDPCQPPADWNQGLLAWAEKVQAARRLVSRGRKTMLQVLHKQTP